MNVEPLEQSANTLEESNNRPGLGVNIGFDLISKTLAVVAAVGYIVGFVFINALCYAFWGFTDLGISAPQCMAAAFWLAVLSGFACLQILAGYFVFRKSEPHLKRFSGWLRREYPRVHRWLTEWSPKLFGLFVVLTYLLPILFSQQINKFMAGHASFVASHAQVKDYSTLILWGSAFLIGTIAMILPISVLKGRRSLRGIPRSQWAGIAFALSITIVALSLCYAFLPASLGGMNPAPQVFWVSRSALPALATCNTDAQTALKLLVEQSAPPTLETFTVHEMYLLHETPDGYILWSYKCPHTTLTLAKDVIKAIQ